MFILFQSLATNTVAGKSSFGLEQERGNIRLWRNRKRNSLRQVDKKAVTIQKYINVSLYFSDLINYNACTNGQTVALSLHN